MVFLFYISLVGVAFFLGLRVGGGISDRVIE